MAPIKTRQKAAARFPPIIDHSFYLFPFFSSFMFGIKAVLGTVFIYFRAVFASTKAEKFDLGDMR